MSKSNQKNNLSKNSTLNLSIEGRIGNCQLKISDVQLGSTREAYWALRLDLVASRLEVLVLRQT